MQDETGREVVLTTRFPNHIDPYFAGSGDAGGVIGDGVAFTSATSAIGDDTLIFSFQDWVHLTQGVIYHENGKIGDHLSMLIFAEATTPTLAPLMDGDCDVVGGTLIPAEGDGAYNLPVDTADIHPVPALDSRGQPAGHWQWDEPDTGFGAFTPKTKGDYYLFTTSKNLTRWANKVPILGSGYVYFAPETRSRKVLPHWKFKVVVHNSGVETLNVAWRMDTARKKTI